MKYYLLTGGLDGPGWSSESGISSGSGTVDISLSGSMGALKSFQVFIGREN
jgi:hypothetical protein